MKDLAERTSLGFAARPARELFGNTVHEGDARLCVGRHDGVANALERRTQPFAALMQLAHRPMQVRLRYREIGCERLGPLRALTCDLGLRSVRHRRSLCAKQSAEERQRSEQVLDELSARAGAVAIAQDYEHSVIACKGARPLRLARERTGQLARESAGASLRARLDRCLRASRIGDERLPSVPIGHRLWEAERWQRDAELTVIDEDDEIVCTEAPRQSARDLAAPRHVGERREVVEHLCGGARRHSGKTHTTAVQL